MLCVRVGKWAALLFSPHHMLFTSFRLNVRRKRYAETLAHMRERILGKLGNRSDNAFKLRKLFAMYDTQHTGVVRILPCNA